MGLTRLLLRVAAGRPHVLLIEVPGGTRARLDVERELRERGWPAAVSPADADLLVVTGPLGPRLQPLADRVWQQVPGPRACLHLREPGAARVALDDARSRLADGGESFATGNGQVSDIEPDGGHGGHDDMAMPGGLAMADRGEDRDGLMLDQLHVPLGPLLVDWPAGLVVHTTLQGDVVQSARVEVVREDGPLEDFWGEPCRRAATGEPVTVGDAARRGVAARLDSLARLLSVTGWPDAAVRTRALRDDVLAGVHTGQVVPRARRLARRLRGSRTLRWLTDGVGVLPTGGDVTARWLAWLADIERALPEVARTSPFSGGREPLGSPVDEPSNALLAVLAGLLEGVELGVARLIVASLDPDLAELGTGAEVTGG